MPTRLSPHLLTYYVKRTIAELAAEDLNDERPNRARNGILGLSILLHGIKDLERVHGNLTEVGRDNVDRIVSGFRANGDYDLADAIEHTDLLA